MKHWRFDRSTAFIGYLPQDVHLYGVSVAENITGEAECNMDELVAICRQLGLHEELAALKDGYETIVNASAPQFSGGQIRLIGLARALWGAPKLIVLDEPTSGLDVDRERRVLEILDRRRDHGAGILISTHSNALIRSATKILWLKWGQTKAYGLRDDVLAKLGLREPA
jgi:ABC-type protease/lipase transport system fused ATPase/permease subunit